MEYETGDCIDVVKVNIPFDTEYQLNNIYNASKALIQFYCEKNDFLPDLDFYETTIQEPIALICEHNKKTAKYPEEQGILMNQFAIYEVINSNNIKNTTIRNLLPDAYDLKLRISYYK